MNQRRLEAEAVRDAMLYVSGQLNLERPLGTYLREVGEGGVGQNVFEPVIRSIKADTRSVYLPRVRSVLPEMLETFDAPDASLVTGSRDITSSPLQSLFLMNNPFVQDQSVALANRLAGVPQEQRIATVYEIAFGRSPTQRERQLAELFLARLEQEHIVDRRTSGPPRRFGTRASGDDSGGMRRGRGRFSGRFGASTEQPMSEAEDSPRMSPLAIYCQALLSSMEFQMID